ncbi:MAG: rod shape-determining protein MreC [Christensenella sp.]|uniref:rod shape-determining protein MreC n=1 Tax=Christensenella sp. TaxID=1935934 RepID=UPI002B1EA561|nr:rod shape-determining protein MreC [Christensenella sp.]MEA5002364.1 rod shape-determining protein MreC [Christensenella sp.]
MGFLRNKPLVVTIVVVVVLIILMVATGSGNKAADSGANIVGGAFVPVQKFFYQISDSVGGFFDNIVNSGDAADEKQKLDSELQTIKGQMNDYDEMKAENERLKEMLDYKQKNASQELKVATIIGKNPGNWFDVFTIDLGINDGIAKNMPVITADGLVGRVEEVGLNWAKVMAVIDGRSNVPSIMERTREYGVVKGSVSQDSLDASLYINYLPLDSDVIEGDKVLTSGLDGIYPKGLLVGTVQSASQAGSTGVNVKLTAAVDFRRLEEVFVVVAVDGQATGTSAANETTGGGEAAQPEPSSTPQPGASASPAASAATTG